MGDAVKSIWGAVALACLGSLGAAQDIPRITMQTLDVVSSFAAPPWTTTGDLLTQAEVFQDQGQTANGTQKMIFETIRKGESFDDWGMLYAISAESGLDGDLIDYVGGQIQGFTDACDTARPQAVPRTPVGVMVFVIYCTQYNNRPGVGEVAFFNMQMKNGTLVKNYLHIRVPAFELDPMAGMELSSQQLRGGVQAVSALQLFDVPASD